MLELKRIHYHPATSERAVIKDVTVKAEQQKPLIISGASGSGKTILTMLLSVWAKSTGLTIQTFKIGPDFLDPKQLTLASGRACRNLDLFLSNSQWIKENFSNIN